MHRLQRGIGKAHWLEAPRRTLAAAAHRVPSAESSMLSARHASQGRRFLSVVGSTTRHKGARVGLPRPHNAAQNPRPPRVSALSKPSRELQDRRQAIGLREEQGSNARSVIARRLIGRHESFYSGGKQRRLEVLARSLATPASDAQWVVRSPSTTSEAASGTGGDVPGR